MAGCGYVCPQCEGKGFIEEGQECDYCSTEVKEKVEQGEEENHQRCNLPIRVP